MKKLLAIILILAMLSSVMLTGCNTPVETPEETPAETPAHQHAYGEWTETVAPTCTEVGEKERVCACGEKEIESVFANGHSYASVVTAPTCNDKGYTTHTCSVCNDSYVDTYVDANGHSYTSIVTYNSTSAIGIW